jgi:tRNA pseudouridine38-40 synthase
MDDPNPQRRLRLTIAYDGTPWQGWQGQPNGQGVQNQIETALATVTKVPVSLQGSGRTDTGVHALALTAHCDVPAHLQIAPSGWVRALNSSLPPSIRILTVEVAPPGFHARFDALGKTYRYRLASAEVATNSTPALGITTPDELRALGADARARLWRTWVTGNLWLVHVGA